MISSLAGLGKRAASAHARAAAALGLCLVMAAAVLGMDSRAIAQAGEADYRRFVEGLWPSARAKGVSRATFDRAVQGLSAPNREVLEKAAYQPEFVRPIWHYMASAVSEKRIETGKRMLEEYRSILDAIEAKYGVDRHVVIAIWGMETSYGEFMGQFNVIDALATLAYTGSRQRFGRSQLLAALQVLERGDIVPEQMRGSWAGAMGHTQFIPTTYNAYAADFTGDGKRDIWNSVPDALGSTANYLRVSKWRFGETWGYEVDLPSRFNAGLAGLNTVKTLAQWQSLGVRRVADQPFPRPSDRASLILPAGIKGPAFLVLNNFRSILRYNNAQSYALAVGHLSDRIRGFGPFVNPWPTDDPPLIGDQRMELQRLLTQKGYSIGDIDGVIGSRTEAAVREYQRASGLPVDGLPTVKLLERLRGDI